MIPAPILDTLTTGLALIERAFAEAQAAGDAAAIAALDAYLGQSAIGRRIVERGERALVTLAGRDTPTMGVPVLKVD